MVRVVICDDESATVEIIQYFIERTGYPIQIVGTASNGTDALNLIRKEKPDLAFMDIHMPFMTGFDVIQQTQDVKFIIITAYDSFEHAQMALRLEVSDILAKPIRLDQLQQSIDRALDGRYTENSTVNTALAYIQKHYREDIHLGELAAEVCCTESHLSRLFRQYMDETVISYIHHVRIRMAVNLLKDGMSVQEAAEAVGYQSLNNFYKYFKQFMKETPAAWLKK